jgi:hypothetical protein
VAIFHASTKSISRSAGRSAVAAIAYRTACRLVDERTGQVHDYTRKGGVLSTEILLPDGSSAERNALWNAAEAAEKRKDARTAREWVIALPSELDTQQRQELAVGFGIELATRYGVAVDLAIHAPDHEGDNRNHHAHILTTTRQVYRDESRALVLGKKAVIELSDRDRRALGLGAIGEEITAVRQLWEQTANRALEQAGRAERIDARSLKAQGIDREATRHMGPSATEMERRGIQTDRGDMNRQAAANNQERAQLVAEVIDLQAQRQRRDEERRAARREAAAARRQAQKEATGRAIRESIEQGARELEAWTAKQAAPLVPTPTPAPAQALQPSQKPQQAPPTPAVPVQSRQVVPTSAPRPPERAAPPVRQESPAAPAQLPQQRRNELQEQLLRMSATELRAYIRAHEPAWPESLATLDPVVTAAQEKVLTLEGQDAAQLRRQQLAEQEAANWRAEHPLRAAAHDRDWVRSGYLDEREESIADAKTRRVVLEFEIKEARKAHKEAHAAALARFQEQQAPIRKHLAQVEELRQKRQAQEVEQAQREKLVSSMLDAVRLHADGRLNVANPQMRDMLTRLTADRRTPEQQRARMVEMLERDPHTQRWMQAQIEQLRPQLQRLQPQQQRHGPRLGR